jgi:hypothetical protein
MTPRDGRSFSVSPPLYLVGLVIVRPPGGGDGEL